MKYGVEINDSRKEREKKTLFSGHIVLRYWGKRRQSLEDRCEGTFQTHVHMVNDGRSSKNAGQAMHIGVKIDFKRIVYALSVENEREYKRHFSPVLF